MEQSAARVICVQLLVRYGGAFQWRAHSCRPGDAGACLCAILAYCVFSPVAACSFVHCSLTLEHLGRQLRNCNPSKTIPNSACAGESRDMSAPPSPNNAASLQLRLHDLHHRVLPDCHRRHFCSARRCACRRRASRAFACVLPRRWLLPHYVV